MAIVTWGKGQALRIGSHSMVVIWALENDLGNKQLGYWRKGALHLEEECLILFFTNHR
jgi:hypothetical protein